MNDEDEYVEIDGNSEVNHNLPLNNRRMSSSTPIPKRLREIRSGNTSAPKRIRGNNGGGLPSKNGDKKDNSISLKDKLANNKQKNRGLLSRFRKNKNEDEENKTTANESSEKTESDDNGVEEVVSKAAKIKKVLSILGSLSLIILLVFFAIIVIAILSALIGNPIAALLGFGNGNAETVSSPGSPTYQKEINYYKKVQEGQTNYKNRCDTEIGREYLNASIMYYYYKADVPIDLNDDDGIPIDYDRMSNMVDTIVDLMPCDINYNINGNFYNNLKNSSEFRNYYSDVLKKESIDEIIEGIFEIGKISIVEEDTSRSVYIPENTTIAAPAQVTTGITGNKSSTISNTNNPSAPSSIQVSFKDYILGVVYANVDSSYLEDNEKAKAYIVALTTNILAKNNLSINTSTVSLSEDYNTLYCNPEYGCSYVVKNNVLSLQVGGGEGGNGNTIFLGGKYFYRTQMDDSLKKKITNLINDVYGKVMVNKEDKYIEVNISKINNSSASKYEDILKEVYSDLKIKNIRENVYDNGVNYGNTLVQTPTIFYDQWDYTDSFCSSSNIIRYAGCGISAMAIVVSTYENSNEYNPRYMNNRMTNAYGNAYCRYGEGTYVGFFQKEAEHMGYKILMGVGKYSVADKNLVTSHLMKGHLVIARMGPGLFTTGGHYIVLSGIDPDTKKVYVTDPYNYMNKIINGSNSGNGWHSFNDIIIPQVKGDGAFYIIWKE